MKPQAIPTLPVAGLTNAEVAGRTLVEAAKDNPAIWVLTADVMHSTKVEPFALAYPDRFINVGIAEQTMMGVAAGLATCGKIPFATTFAVLATLRACVLISPIQTSTSSSSAPALVSPSALAAPRIILPKTSP
jgi:transketolase C-terminal domain/subunit